MMILTSIYISAGVHVEVKERRTAWKVCWFVFTGIPLSLFLSRSSGPSGFTLHDTSCLDTCDTCVIYLSRKCCDESWKYLLPSPPTLELFKEIDHWWLRKIGERETAYSLTKKILWLKNLSLFFPAHTLRYHLNMKQNIVE